MVLDVKFVSVWRRRTEVRELTSTFGVTGVTGVGPWLGAWLCVEFFAMLKDSMFGGSLTVAIPSSYQNGQAQGFHNTTKRH